MAFTIDEAFLPATLTAPPMTDKQFADFCSEHPDLFFEMTSEGEIIVSPPTYSLTGARNLKILGQLYNWAEMDGRGTVTESSAGFVLPNGARRSPDAAWVSHTQLGSLNQDALGGYWHLCPQFIIELKSKTDRLRNLRLKMQEWIDNGAQLAWLIDPDTRGVEIYRPGLPSELRTDIDSITAEAPLEGFHLNLRRVWDPFAKP